MQPLTPQTDDQLIQEAELIAQHYLNEFNKELTNAQKARLTMAIMFTDPGISMDDFGKYILCNNPASLTIETLDIFAPSLVL